MTSFGAWQTLIISNCKRDENIKHFPTPLLYLRESICLLNRQLWSVIMNSFSGTVQQLSGMKSITRVINIFFTEKEYFQKINAQLIVIMINAQLIVIMVKNN